jgi:predicted lipid-binding transport protein (Tim44 family)
MFGYCFERTLMFNMKSLFTLMLVALVTTVFVSPPAEAKRLGGGMKFGKSYKYSRPVQKNTAPAQSARQPTQAQQAAGAAGGAKRGGMMGMLGGLAAGGLLAALFFGGAFENINFFDILLLGGLALGGVALFRAMRRNAAPAYPREATATPTGYQPPPSAPEPQRPASGGFQIPEIGAALKGQKLSEQPDWFDENAFMAEAANHFMTLQEAWDSGDMSRIREYVTPEFFDYISKERAALPAQQETKITDLQPQLLDLLRDGDKVVAAILFQGYEQEGDGQPEAFADIWHVEHPADDPNADWLLAGIRKLDEVDS